MTYAEKLKDPRWQKKRLEILQRDDWTCQICKDKESTLHVHHKYYMKNVEPWDYEDHLLVTLCESCHEYEREHWEEYGSTLIKAIKRAGFMADDAFDFVEGFAAIELQDMPERISAAYGWALADADMQKFILESYDNMRIRRKLKAA